MKRLALLSCLALAHAVPAAAEMLPGYDRFDLVADHRARPIAASIWYPAANPTYRAPVGDGPIFDPTFAFIGPAVAHRCDLAVGACDCGRFAVVRLLA